QGAERPHVVREVAEQVPSRGPGLAIVFGHAALAAIARSAVRRLAVRKYTHVHPAAERASQSALQPVARRKPSARIPGQTRGARFERAQAHHLPVKLRVVARERRKRRGTDELAGIGPQLVGPRRHAEPETEAWHA